ncbi:unnamed protein product [Danaus chrysippus]|uniref:(African queen) hypothetical protein n=1 Tax=Danaus chrysippus TaxID=151541 RepID=A0A8J2QWU3_9NEOP|nr:unnamed protein product [Danaus chrysippus]
MVFNQAPEGGRRYSTCFSKYPPTPVKPLSASRRKTVFGNYSAVVRMSKLLNDFSDSIDITLSDLELLQALKDEMIGEGPQHLVQEEDAPLLNIPFKKCVKPIHP